MLVAPELMLIFLLVGLFTGLLSGMTGLGGGVIIVPVLIALFHRVGLAPMREAQVAVATSLSILVLNNYLTARHYHKARIIDWDIVRIMTPWMILGGCVGPLLSSYISSKVMSIFFTLFMFYVAWRIFFTKTPQKAIKPSYVLRAYAFVFGILSGFLGIAGGALIIPFLMRQGLLTRESAAASACITLPVVIIASIIYAFSGWALTDLHAGFLGFIYLPAAAGIALLSFFSVPVGTKIALKLHNDVLRKIFAGIVFILALQLLWSLFRG